MALTGQDLINQIIKAPLAHKVPGLRRYVQNHILGERTRADIETTAVEIDGIAELWFDHQAALETASRTPEIVRRSSSRLSGRDRAGERFNAKLLPGGPPTLFTPGTRLTSC